MTCKCGGRFCYECGMKSEECACNTARLPAIQRATVLREMIKGILQKRRQRLVTFLMGSRCEESLVSMLPPDVLRRIGEAIK